MDYNDVVLKRNEKFLQFTATCLELEVILNEISKKKGKHGMISLSCVILNTCITNCTVVKVEWLDKP